MPLAILLTWNAMSAVSDEMIPSLESIDPKSLCVLSSLCRAEAFTFIGLSQGFNAFIKRPIEIIAKSRFLVFLTDYVRARIRFFKSSVTYIPCIHFLFSWR